MQQPRSKIVKQLYEWSATIRRDLPWKSSSDPYQIWLSEVILQQTRVAQGRPYWQRFVDTYPTVQDLARADLDAVYKLWEGLGYYSRARNLHAAAQRVVDDYQGRFPDTYAELLTLPGVGPYTAAAIASFAFGLPVAVVDGNVMRVITRLYDSHLPIDTSAGKKFVRSAVDKLLDPDDPARFNQAIMDFGALQCVPRQPSCDSCPLAADCLAHQRGTVSELPVKAKKLKKRTRYFHYFFVIDFQGQTVLQQRQSGDVWAGLYEWPMIETTSSRRPKSGDWPAVISGKHKVYKTAKYKQTLTHQHIYATTTVIRLEESILSSKVDGTVVPLSELNGYAYPRLIRQAIADHQSDIEQWSDLK